MFGKKFQKNLHKSNISLIYYDRIDVSERFDVNKASA